MIPKPPPDVCPLCRREIPSRRLAIAHHLVPCHKGGSKGEKVLLCKPCGEQVHQLFDNRELRDKYNTLELLLANERVQEWAAWANKQKDFNCCMKAKKRR
jgi:hypothetical protein